MVFLCILWYITFKTGGMLMHASGIICEYNPFHYGHRYHIEKAKEASACEVLVCVMSGNFVQRGEPAIIDKWERARVALSQGVDLILELPIAYATQSAIPFAQGAVDILHIANVQEIVFGSETNDLETLKKLAAIDSNSYRDLMKDGLSCAKAYEIIYGKCNPNDILGINYIKAMTPYKITPLCIQRTNAYHDVQLTDTFASASALRAAIAAHEDITKYTPMTNLEHPRTLEQDYPYIQRLLLSLSNEYLQTIFLMDEGIEQHLKIQAAKCNDLASFLQAATSKRYPTSRIRRCLLHLMLQTQKKDIDTLPKPSFLRVLGFNSIGQSYLKELKQNDITIASRINQVPLPYRTMEIKAAQMYGRNEDRKRLVEKELQAPIRL